jgi:hypothetical protein
MRERLLIALIVVVLLIMPVVAFVGEINAEQSWQRNARPGLAGRYPQLNIPARSEVITPTVDATQMPEN